MKADTHFYKFKPAEVGILSEIMLPKKVQYQGALFGALQKGLANFSFARYYQRNQRHIHNLMESYTFLSGLNEATMHLFDEKYPNIFTGYTMHEGDGTYVLQEVDPKKKRRIRFVEERTQVIKVYFIPQYGDILQGMPVMEDPQPDLQSVINFSDLFFTLSRIASFDHRNIHLRLAPHIENGMALQSLGLYHPSQALYIMEELKLWVDAVAFFLFGFMIHEICMALNSMFGKKQLRYMEEEIWAASQWGVLINKTVLKQV